ncbi:cytochrome c oxidase subunit VIa family protein [Loa loa]|uniref:Cytochrome c oxidase subunit VIa family protein n=1 Tax=Loa loa TaxID=7209 RepID=A0A1I7W550_LOALO|nr:cytochrome c oxidase subunit VIa family protein [Loa loa]EFO23341.1 cytochrome c oxidase subunit VIa family protein [Loa loa]
MSPLLYRLFSVTRSQLSRTRLKQTTKAISTSQVRHTQSAANYDEEADDRDRFKYDKFYNAVVMFGSPVVLAILFYVTYLGHQMEEHFDQEKYVHYPYLTVRNKPLPWGDGNHALFHNPEKNYVPGVGFEKKQEKHH